MPILPGRLIDNQKRFESTNWKIEVGQVEETHMHNDPNDPDFRVCDGLDPGQEDGPGWQELPTNPYPRLAAVHRKPVWRALDATARRFCLRCFFQK